MKLFERASLEDSLYQLNVFRCFFCIFAALYIWFRSLGIQHRLFYVFELSSPQLLYGLPTEIYSFFRSELFGVSLLTTWNAAICVILLIAGIKANQRILLIIATCMFFVTEFLSASFLRAGASNPVFYALFILSASAKATELSFLGILRAPIKSEADCRIVILGLELILPLIYLNAALSKVLHGGLSWLDGSSLEAYLFFSYLQTQNYFALWLSEHGWACFFMALGTMLLEGGYWLIFIFSSLRAWMFFAGIVFHLVTYFVMGHNFLWSYFPLYLIYIGWFNVRKVSFRL